MESGGVSVDNGEIRVKDLPRFLSIYSKVLYFRWVKFSRISNLALFAGLKFAAIPF